MITRQTTYISTENLDFFSWIHTSEIKKNCAVIICSPTGYEYTHSHRSIRSLADTLAENGFPTLRFDYAGTADSPGKDLNENSLQLWKENIKAAISYMRKSTGCKKIALLGVRLGGTLATLTAAEVETDFLILWNPVVSGRRFIRELQAIAATAKEPSLLDPTIIESAGFLMSQATAEEIKKINLLEIKPQITESALIIARDDLEEDFSLVEHLENIPINTTQTVAPGYLEMMAEPQFTKIPQTAISKIASWLISKNQENLEIENHFEIKKSTSAFQMKESTHFFGKNKNIFGILCESENGKSADTATVLLNSGSVHHVGPNRIYVNLSRSLTREGHSVFRFDIQGLGDSVLPNNPKENHPYQDTAIEDTEAALKYLSETLGFKRFILIGLCSGAHTAFHASLNLKNYEILDTVLINPLTFYWKDGMSLETNSHLQEVAYYKDTMKDSKKWMKLFKGQVNVKSAARVAFTHTLKISQSLLTSTTSSKLSKDLKSLYKIKRPLSLFIASQEPGFNLLLDEAKEVTKKGLKEGNIRVQFIDNADHTFSRKAPRSELIEKLATHIQTTSYFTGPLP